MTQPETKIVEGRRPCGFCGDVGSHALISFIAEDTDTVVCSDCIEIFYTRLKSYEQSVIRRYPLTRQ